MREAERTVAEKRRKAKHCVLPTQVRLGLLNLEIRSVFFQFQFRLGLFSVAHVIFS